VEIEGIKTKVRELLRCPVRDEGEWYAKELRERLLELWVEAVATYPYQVRDEGDLAVHWYETNLDDREDAELLEWDSHNLSGWINEARIVFLEKVYPVVHMDIVSPTERQKHWPMTKLTDEEVRAKSVGGESLFLPKMSVRSMVEIMCLLRGRYFDDGLQRKHAFYYVDCDEVVGASRGELVPWVCFDADFRIAKFHCYPVTLGEVDHASAARLSDWGVRLSLLPIEKPTKQP